jgi:EAL domain-containing protein (putative c-di-GMP-specific phosphodiesterase class I)
MRKKQDKKNKEIVRTIIALARSLKLDIIAEGVELDYQLTAVTCPDCHYGRRFLFSKPLSADNVDRWIRSEIKPAS